MSNFWLDLPKPFSVLAPMDDVTDTVFRQVVSWCYPPDVYFTEFTSVEGLCSRGRERVIPRLRYTPCEKPLVAQIWGLDPSSFYKVAKELSQMGFAGIDINMGCPKRDVVKGGACAGLIKNHTLTKEIITATKEGACGLPVSVKTRIGFNQIVTDEWIPFLLEQKIDAITIHGRTAKEMSNYPVHWDEIEKAVIFRNNINPKTVIIGNGDILSWVEAQEKILKYKVDGIMIGRGIFHNLWVFDKSGQKKHHSLDSMLKLLIRHAELFENTWGRKKNFKILRRFFKIYVQGFTGASKLRDALVKTDSLEEVKEIIFTEMK